MNNDAKEKKHKVRNTILLIIIIIILLLLLIKCSAKKPNESPNLGDEFNTQEVTHNEHKQEDIPEEEPVIEESKKENTTLNNDITNMYFWVVFYDQYGNELQREALKYGTVPSYNSWLPEGFERWVYKNSKRDVGSFTAITGNTYFLAVCNNSSSSSGGGSKNPDGPSGVNYFYFKNIGSTVTSFKLKCDSAPTDNIKLVYSNDKTNWNNFTVGSDVPVQVNEIIYIKADTTNPYMTDSSFNGYYFSSDAPSTESLEVGGSIMTLLDPDDTLRDLSGKDYCFMCLLFEMNNLKNANNLICPATTLSEGCYTEMFGSDAYLESVNVNLLPAKNLSDCPSCYDSMFADCYSLKNVPNLPATQLAPYCYHDMFSMENGSNNVLTSVPANLLHASNLSGCDYCYSGMFMKCNGLVKAPNLPAAVLVNNCYYNMFKGCSSLNSISVGFNSFEDPQNTSGWLTGVSSIGTFKWPGPLTGYSEGSGFIPNGWTVTN